MKTTEEILKMPTRGVWSDGLVGIEFKGVCEDKVIVVGYNNEVIITDVCWDINECHIDDWYIEVYGRRYYGSNCMSTFVR